MKLKKCFFCNKLRFAAYHVTDISPNGEIETYDMCKTCGWEYVKDAYNADQPQPKKEKPEMPEMPEIKTPLDLLAFLMGVKASPKKTIVCECGMDDVEFQKHGKFGCPKCYDTFQEYVERFVYPYHQADEHVGKLPRHQLRKETEASPEEMVKFLKLQLAKAIEVENYEEAAKINTKLKALIQPQSTSSDQ